MKMRETISAYARFLLVEGRVRLLCQAYRRHFAAVVGFVDGWRSERKSEAKWRWRTERALWDG